MEFLRLGAECCRAITLHTTVLIKRREKQVEIAFNVVFPPFTVCFHGAEIENFSLQDDFYSYVILHNELFMGQNDEISLVRLFLSLTLKFGNRSRTMLSV